MQRLFAVRLFIGIIPSLWPGIAALANEPVSSPLTVSGEARIRAEGDERIDYSSNRDFFALRLRPDFNFTADPAVHILFEPQAIQYLGNRSYLPSSAMANIAQPTSGVTTAASNTDPSVAVHQAFIDYRPASETRLIFGRQILSYGDELVLGAADWNNAGRVFDALRAQAAFGAAKVDFFYSKLVDTNITTAGPGDLNLWGLYSTLNLGEQEPSIDVYALAQANHLTTTAQDIGAIGARSAATIDRVDYRAEVTGETGSGVGGGADANQVDAELGYHLDLPLQPRIALEGFRAGRDYFQFYPSPHRWLGYADLFGRRNIEGFVVHLSANPFEKTIVGVDFHKFSRVSTALSPYKTDGVTAFGSASASTSTDLGHEIDLTAKYSLTRTLELSAGGSIISAGDYFSDQYPGVTPVFYYMQLEARF